MAAALPFDLIAGPCGRSWSVQAQPAGAELCAWVIEAPQAHPFWSQYVLLGLHLRDVDGQPPAFRHRPDATHEMHLFAVAPAHRLAPGGRVRNAALLKPPNYAYQWTAATDAEALQRLEACRRAILHGHLNPDTAFRRHWDRTVWPDAVPLIR